MTLTVRLKPDLEAQLESYAELAGVSKSHVVMESLARYLALPPFTADPWEIYQSVFRDRKGSGHTDRSETVKTRYRECVKDRHTQQGARFGAATDSDR